MPDDRFASLQRQLNVTTIGGGRPIIALHGGPGYDHTSFRPWLDGLAGSGQLVYFDYPGNGRAAPVPDWSTVSLTTYVDAVASLHLSLGESRAVLFGHSFGGFVALEYALRFPGRVAGLVLCNTAPAYDHLPSVIGRLEQRADPDTFAKIMAFVGDVPADDRAFAAGIQPLLPFYVHPAARGVAPTLFDAVHFRSAAFVHGLAMTSSYNVRARLSEITAPTLVIAADDDLIFAEHEGPSVLASQMPNAELYRFTGCGHYPFAEHPEQFVSVVTEWLTRLP